MALTKIGSIGINTGIAFAGVTTIATLNASDNVLSVGGTVNLSVMFQSVERYQSQAH